MSSIFDSAVYAMRNRYPFVVPKFLAFVKEKAYAVPDENVVFEVTSRNVKTGLWFSLTWCETDGKVYRAESQEFELMMWRAIQIHCQVERADQLMRVPGFEFQDGSGT